MNIEFNEPTKDKGQRSPTPFINHA